MTTSPSKRNPHLRRYGLGLLTGAALMALCGASQAQSADAPATCDRACMTDIVEQMLGSMVAHNPDTLPVAQVYKATENSHGAALGMMTLWRTVTEAHTPDLLAIDVPAGQAFILTQISEGGNKSVLWGRIKVENRKISELELYVNRSRGDHGFSFDAENLPKNLYGWMHPPVDRTKVSRADLEALSKSVFAEGSTFDMPIGKDCAFLEAGSHVVDPGLDDVPAEPAPDGSKRDPETPLGCIMPPNHPVDPKAREIVVDEELGIVVDAAMVPGVVYPYPFHGHMMSAFIPDQMKEPGVAQQAWFERKIAAGQGPLLHPEPAMGVAMHVLQLYNGALQGMQINVNLDGPEARSVWVK
jgi:hypothetical protein